MSAFPVALSSLLLLIVLLTIYPASACTTIGVTPSASTDGSTFTTHNVDCLDCDFRVAKTPPADWPKGSMRPIYKYVSYYPHKIVYNRSLAWEPSSLDQKLPQTKKWKVTKPMGYIPQVSHTYGLIEFSYGIMNDQGVAMGESTAGSKFGALPIDMGGKALLAISDLTQLGCERAKTAREAVQIMGDLAVKYGFYGEDYDMDDLTGSGGEILVVADPKEVWVFHVSCDPTGSSALWVAQRVPDGHVFVAANMFRIRNVKKSHPDFLYSDNLWDVAESSGLWDPKQSPELDFTLTFQQIWSTRLAPYSTFRLWGLYKMIAPSVVLPMITTILGDDYPFSVKPDSKVSLETVKAMMRYQYEGTELDLTQGLGSGPYGDPHRHDVQTDVMSDGGFVRGVSIHRTQISQISQLRSFLPKEIANVVWVAQHSPRTSVYIPLYANAPLVPKMISSGSHYRYDPSVLYWINCVLTNTAHRFYSFTIGDVVSKQNKVEADISYAQKEIEKKAIKFLKEGDKKSAVKALGNFSHKMVDMVAEEWTSLLHYLFAKYHDGGVLVDEEALDLQVKKMGYPVSWLEAVGYFKPYVDLPLDKAPPSVTINRAALYYKVDYFPTNNKSSNVLWFLCGFVCPGLFYLALKLLHGMRRAKYAVIQ